METAREGPILGSEQTPAPPRGAPTSGHQLTARWSSRTWRGDEEEREGISLGLRGGGGGRGQELGVTTWPGEG